MQTQIASPPMTTDYPTWADQVRQLDRSLARLVPLAMRVGIDPPASVKGKAPIAGLSRLNAHLAVLGKGAKVRRGSVVPTGVTVEPRYRPGRWKEE